MDEKNTGNDRQLHKCHNMPAKISWCTQQGSGLENLLGQTERLGETWMPWTPAVEPILLGAGAYCCYHVALQLSGERSRTQREVGPME